MLDAVILVTVLAVIIFLLWNIGTEIFSDSFLPAIRPFANDLNNSRIDNTIDVSENVWFVWPVLGIFLLIVILWTRATRRETVLERIPV